MTGRKRDIRKVLVIQLGPLGEFVQALAAMKHVREAHPQAEITLLTTPPFETLGGACPYFNLVQSNGQPGGFGETAALIGRLRSARYDRVYDLQNSSLTNLYFQLLRPFPPQWSGRAVGCSLPHRNRRGPALAPLERNAEQLMDAGIWPDAPVAPGAAPPSDLSWILNRAAYRGAMAKTARPYVVLAPGGWEAKLENRWPAELYGQLGQILRAEGLDVLVIGGPEDSGLARTIQRTAQARDLTGRTDFAHTAALVARASLAVGNHLDLLHLIAATGAPTVTLLPKALDPLQIGPRGHVAVLQAERLKELTASEVATALRRLLPAEQKTL